MAKQITGYIKLQVAAGTANPSPPIGPALGQHGVNIMEFCKAFNAKTEKLEKGMPIPVVITVYQDRSFTFITKTPPMTFLIKKAAEQRDNLLTSVHAEASSYGVDVENLRDPMPAVYLTEELPGQINFDGDEPAAASSESSEAQQAPIDNR